MAKHNKFYKTKEEYIQRRQTFEQALSFVTEHNSRPDISSQVGINFFSDLTSEEFRVYLGDSGAPESSISYESS